MGRNNSSLVDQRCKKHPSHKQSKGVCPSCLREKLSHLSSFSSPSLTTNRSDSSSCSSLSPCSLSDSNLSSLGGSPPHHHHQQQQQHKSFSFMFINGGKALKKSRSLAFVEKEKKKRGFLSKLIGRRKEKDLLHSNTLKERSSTNKWALFS